MHAVSQRILPPDNTHKKTKNRMRKSPCQQKKKNQTALLAHHQMETKLNLMRENKNSTTRFFIHILRVKANKKHRTRTTPALE